VSPSIYDQDLPKTDANHTPLSPLGFLERAAQIYPRRIAVIHGALHYDYQTLYARCRRLASALRAKGIGKGDTVAIMAPNVPAMLEAHYGVAMIGAVVNTLNIRLDAPALAFILDHGEAKVLITDIEFSGVIKQTLAQCAKRPFVIDILDDAVVGGEALGEIDYERFISTGDPDFVWAMPDDEWDAISLNYTSGTTGNPKGVVFHHRGAYLASMSTLLAAQITSAPVYLWTLPMFHCNGWCFTWALSIVGGTHVCLRKVDAAHIFAAIADHKVTHMCGAPIIMSMILNARSDERRALTSRVEFITAAAPPPAAVIGALEALGFNVTHVYGLTETYGPATVNAWHNEWSDLPADERASLKARQGVRYPALEGLSLRDPETMAELPSDGETMGEVMFRGNIVMKGYLKNPKATKEAFAGGWFHSGDLGVRHPDGYIQLRDRSKDIIISGGENISSIEVESVLYKHPAVLDAAVVAKPDEKWGETPCAFITLKVDAAPVTEQDIIAYCQANLARFKCPRRVVFIDLPKTSTGKIQKFKLRELAKTV
jgi:fatty-acyl-CoA synthase